ncbi:MAG: GntR family transcriptional regulator [Pseudorhodoplanes sp.]|nr:MAG: GntR family transcriptional regulator [Pseudorhodoplanes sp.]
METLVSSRPLVEQAYTAILDAICSGRLKPGERLTQADVAERLNVSRQPVHNALQVLKAQGFVRESGRRGLIVAPLDPGLFDAIYQLRSAIEPLAVRLATPRLTEADLERGRALLAAGAEAAKANGSASVKADAAFHSWIYDLSGNALIVDTMRLNWRHLQRAMGEVLRHPSMLMRVWNEHRTIVDAMAAGDAEKAALLMHGHVVGAYEDVRRRLSEGVDNGPAAPARGA